MLMGILQQLGECSPLWLWQQSGGLTQQYDGTQQDSDEGSSAEARRAAQRLSVTQLHVAVAVAGAHSDGEGASAALHGIVAIGDHHGNQIHALLEAAVAGAAGQDAGGVIWGSESSG